MPPILMQHDDDPKEVIRKKIGLTKDGKIPGFSLQGNRVLLAIYERPKVTKKGIQQIDPEDHSYVDFPRPLAACRT
jgi:hypothetical protein